MKKKVVILSSFLLMLDILIKYFVRNYVTRIVIVPNFFAISYTKNSGAAFSLLEGNRFLLIFVSILILCYLIYELIKGNLSKLDYFSHFLILTGLIGNLIDRIFFKYVIDYFEFQLFGSFFPIFNLADCFIVIGVVLLLFSTLRGDEKNAI